MNLAFSSAPNSLFHRSSFTATPIKPSVSPPITTRVRARHAPTASLHNNRHAQSPLRNLLLAAAAALSVTTCANSASALSAPSQTRASRPDATHSRINPRSEHTRQIPHTLRLKTASAPVAVRSRSPPLATIQSPASVAAAPSLKDVVSFWVGEYLMWNPGAKVVTLLATTLLCMYLGSFLYRLADPSNREVSAPFWHSVRAIANPLEDDWQLPGLRTTSIILASVGMVVFAILVGMVTESVESAVQNADGVNSTVIVKDHILICGWSNHVSHILRDLSNLGSKVKVVVMAPPDEKENMLEELRSALSETQRNNLRLFYRPGAPLMPDDLRRVAAGNAQKIILVNTRGGDLIDADRRVISRALALRQNLPAFKGDIVAELNNTRDEGILRSILSNTSARSVETVNAEQLLFRFMAQAIRQPGLADVVSQLMGSNPSTNFQVVKVKDIAPHLVGMNYADIRPTSIPNSILCGFFNENGEVEIDSGHAVKQNGAVLNGDTDLLVLGTGRGSDSVSSSSSKLSSTEVSNAVFSMRSMANGRGAESYLFCGWRPDMADMLGELDKVLSHGSKITVLDNDVPDSLDLNLKNISVRYVRERADRYENLEQLLSPKAKLFDHVVLIGSALGKETELKQTMGQEEDTKTLASLIYVNELLAKQQEYVSRKGSAKVPLVTIEFINEGVAKIAKGHGNIANVILPQDLGAKIAAQTVRDSRLNAVWSELLSQRGREVYLKPCSKYVSGDEERSFAFVSDRAAEQKNDLVIGYVDSEGNIVINPQSKERFASRRWQESEAFIVLCED